jgi:ABC-2 type transport system ATP-binding protein
MQFLLMLGLAARPKLLLLDEITAVIDVEGQRYFLDRLRSYTEEGGTVVITTNIISELNDYTDHLLLLQDKHLVVDGAVSDLKQKFSLLKQTRSHAIFKHPGTLKVRNDSDGKALFIATDEACRGEELDGLVIDQLPRLEDILVYYFHMKEELDEELAA